MVKVTVGDANPRTFQVHEQVLQSQSAFFEAALGKAWKEGQELAITLKEEDPDIFYCYGQWLYPGQIACKTADRCNCTTLVALWILGDKIICPKLQNCVVDVMIANCRATKLWLNGEVVTLVYSKTAQGSQLRKSMLDIYVKVASPTWLNSWNDKKQPEFIAELARALVANRALTNDAQDRLKSLQEGAVCDQYHVHEEGAKCEAK